MRRYDVSSPMYVLAASGSIFSLKNVTTPVPAVAVAAKGTPPPATDPAAASMLAFRAPPVRVSSSKQKDGQGPTSDLTVDMRPYLLHQRKLLDAGLRLPHKHQAHQGPGLCRLLPALLLESHVLDFYVPISPKSLSFNLWFNTMQVNWTTACSTISPELLNESA
jgi:hypothetical protein